MNHENFRDDEYRLPDMIVPDGYVQPFVCVVDPLIVRKVSSVEWTPLEREIGFKLTYNSDPDVVADFCGRNNAKNRRRLALERLAKVRKNLDVEVSEFKVSKEEASQGPVGLVVEKEDLEVTGRSVTVIEAFDTTAQEAVFTPLSLVPEQKMEICIGSGDEGEVISAVIDNQVIKLAEIPQNSVEEIVDIRDQCLGVEPLIEGFDEYHIMNTRSYGSLSGVSREPGQADVYYRNIDFLRSELYQYFEGYGDDYLDGFYSDLFCRNRVIVGNVSTINMGLQDRGGDKLSLMKEIFPWVMGKDGVIVRPRWSQDEDRFLWKYRRLITDKMIYSHKLQGENPFEGKGGLSFAMNRLAIRRRVNCGLIFRILVILYERSNQLIRLVGRGFDQEIVLHWRRLFNNLWTVFRYMSTYGIQTAYNRYGSLVFELINELYTLGLHHCQVYSEGEGEGVKLYVDAGIRRGDPNFLYQYNFKYAHFGTDWIEDVIGVLPVELYPVMVLVSKRSYMCVKYAMIRLREKQQDEACGVNSQGIQDRECCSGVQECEECERYHGELIEKVHPLNSFLEAQSYVYIYNHELAWLYKWIHENRVDVARLIECIQAYRNASNCLVIFHTICFLLYTMGYGHSSWILRYYVKLFPIRMISGIICDRFTMFS